MQKKNLSIILILCVVLMASCAKEGPTGPIGPAGPVQYGDIACHVSLYDKYGSRVLTGLTSVSLYLQPNVVDTAVHPDATGLYTYIYFGTNDYNINAADSGYGPTLLNNVNFVSGTLNQDIKLSAIPDSFLTGFISAHNNGSLNDSLLLTVKPDARERNCIVFVGGGSSVSNNPAYYLISYRIGIPGNINTVAFTVPQQDLLDAGFTSGALVYYAAYSYVVNDGSVYEDPTTGNNVYNAVNDPIIDTTRVP